MSSDYPLQFSAHLWVRSVRSVMRARGIWFIIFEFIEFCDRKKNDLRKHQLCPSLFDLKDLIVPLKLQFFEDLVKTLSTFLVLYQTHQLMVPFLGEGYETLCKLSYKNFIRKDVLESAKTASLLIQLDVADKTNRNDVYNFDLNFGKKCEFKRLTGSKEVTDIHLFQFKNETLDFWQVFQPCNGKKFTPILACKFSDMFVPVLHEGILKFLQDV